MGKLNGLSRGRAAIYWLMLTVVGRIILTRLSTATLPQLRLCSLVSSQPIP